MRERKREEESHPPPLFSVKVRPNELWALFDMKTSESVLLFKGDLELRGKERRGCFYLINNEC